MPDVAYASATEQEFLIGSGEEIPLAIERKQVTFPMVMKLLYYSNTNRDIDARLRQKYLELYRSALTQFIVLCGGIRESFYANEFAAGVVLTKTDVFFNIWWDECDFDTTAARALEAEINDLRFRACLYLPGDHREICMQRLFRLYKTLISSLHSEHRRLADSILAVHDHSAESCHPGHKGFLKSLVSRDSSRGEMFKSTQMNDQEYSKNLKQIYSELDGVQEYYRRVGSERGKVQYVASSAIGATIIIALVASVLAFPETSGLRIWAGVILAGAVGALLSVLERLTRGSLKVQFETGVLAMIISGASRPVVGALSGLALFVLVNGNFVLSIGKASSETDRSFFFTALAFLAGFSERLLKDVLGNATQVVTGEKEKHHTGHEPRSQKEIKAEDTKSSSQVDE
jgi:hypothetical protein